MPPSLSDAAAKLNVDTAVQLSPSGEPVPEFDDEQVASVSPAVQFVFGETLDAGAGTLFVTNRRVVWVGGAGQPPVSFSLRYQQIVMHAVCRDPGTYARPCIYLQLDDGSEDMMAQDEEEEAEEEVPAEVRLVPADESKVEEIFTVLCQCAALNPDSDAEAEGEGDFFFNEDEVVAGLDADTRAAFVAARLGGGAMDLEEGAEEEDGAEGDGGDVEVGEGDLDALVGGDPSRFEDDDEEEGDGAAAAAGAGARHTGQNGAA